MLDNFLEENYIQYLFLFKLRIIYFERYKIECCVIIFLLVFWRQNFRCVGYDSGCLGYFIEEFEGLGYLAKFVIIYLFFIGVYRFGNV